MFWDCLSFIFKKHWLQIGLAILISGVIIGISMKYPEGWFYVGIDWLDPLLGLLTLLIAILVWIIQVRREWEDNLPKRLTVQFDYGGRIMMKCEEAMLVGESDIRNWGQQIGQQMSFGTFLKFDPYIKLEQPKIKYNKTWREYYKHYIATFYLTELPDLPKPPDAATKAEYEENFNKGHCLIWSPEYGEDKTVRKKPKWNKNNSPTRRI